MSLIDLRSDTVSMFDRSDMESLDLSKIGDSGFNDDPYVRILEDRSAELMGTEASLLMPSGTMSNQTGLRLLSSPGDEIIIGAGYHINFFESSQTAAQNGLVINTVRPQDGILSTEDVLLAINEKSRWGPEYAVPKILSIENTLNTYGGKIFPLEQISKLKTLCQKYDMHLFMDGARLLNACAKTGITPANYVKDVDMVSFCLSKGVGAPFGSMLCGSKKHIEAAIKYRKWNGGSMHQAGLMAGIALAKLAHWEDRINRDNHLAKLLSSRLSPYWEQPYGCETNMVYIYCPDALLLNRALKDNGILSVAWTPNHLRFVTNFSINEKKIIQAAEIINRLGNLGTNRVVPEAEAYYS